MVFAFGALTFVACNDANKKEDSAETEQMEAERQAQMQAEKEKMEFESNSIAAKAADTDSLSSLNDALQSAEMNELLTVSEGPYTVFAPDNAAFSKVDKATLDTLMKPENREKFAGLLEYHVVEDKITAEDLAKKIDGDDGEYTIATLNGGELKATKEGDNIVLTDEMGNKATIVKTDIEASNGIIHIIDAVVMPKSEDTEI
ncbi:fasciclin domain protein [Christiangramia flava JLT2011]|nr:fasciclin domain protein [Christiangramia flava JLT2011]